MTNDLLLCCLLTTAVLTVCALAVIDWSRLKTRSYDDFSSVLRSFDLAEATMLFDHEEEDRLREIRDPVQFARDQRARLDQAREMIGNAYHNTRRACEWNNTEWYDMIRHHLVYEPPVIEAMKTLRQECAAFLRIAFWDLLYIWLLSLLHFDRWRLMPVPSITGLRKVGSEDILQAYERVRQAAANLARLAYSEAEAQLVLAKM
jgi:hypothetical protein